MENYNIERETEAQPENQACPYCNGDEAIFWKDMENHVFVDSAGSMMAVVHDRGLRFTVKFCPMCGKQLRLI